MYQPAASDTPDLIKTECVTDSGLACPKKKIISGNTGLNLIDCYILCLLTLQIIASWAQSRKLRNKQIKLRNGNRKNTIDILHWNAGRCHWIRQIIHEHYPDLLFVSEADLYNFHQDYEINIDGFKTMESFGYSRLNLLVKEGIEIRLQYQLMNSDVASIWMSVQVHGNKKIMLGGVYQEHNSSRCQH